MKCPVCKGDCFSETKDDYVLDCPHCYGKGEIKEGDWWKCDFSSIGGSIGVVKWTKKHESASNIKPLCRMKEVE